MNKYLLKEIDNKQLWNDFVISNFSFYSFLCSWEWGSLQEKEGNEVMKMGIYNDSILIGVFLIVFVKAKRGSYFFSPHGPLIKGEYFDVLSKILPLLDKLSKEKGASYIRLNSLSLNSIDNKNSYRQLGFIDSPMHLHAENTHLLDLTLDEETLLSNLRKTTRYMVNRARKEGVTVSKANSKEDLDHLIKMHKAHAKRSNGKKTYSAFSNRFIEHLIEVFDNDQLTIMKAEYDGYTEAMLMTIRFGETCVYYIGASDIKHPKFSPSYLLQFEAILEAKRSGCKIYNFWGVSPDDNPKHPIQGVSLFKRGFGGYDYDLLHAQDYVFSRSKYIFNWIIESMRRKKRGYYYKKPA